MERAFQFCTYRGQPSVVGTVEWLPLAPGLFASGTGVFARTECKNDRPCLTKGSCGVAGGLGVTCHESQVWTT